MPTLVTGTPTGGGSTAMTSSGLPVGLISPGAGLSPGPGLDTIQPMDIGPAVYRYPPVDYYLSPPSSGVIPPSATVIPPRRRWFDRFRRR